MILVARAVQEYGPNGMNHLNIRTQWFLQVVSGESSSNRAHATDEHNELIRRYQPGYLSSVILFRPNLRVASAIFPRKKIYEFIRFGEESRVRHVSEDLSIISRNNN